jgi:ABC-2 type transport system ATP-binding protein
MVKGSDRIELEVQGDAEKTLALLRAQPDVLEVTHDSGGPIIVSTDDGAHVMPKIISLIEEAGGAVTSIKLERMSLEDVFIRFTGRRLRDQAARKAGFFDMTFGLPRPPRPF